MDAEVFFWISWIYWSWEKWFLSKI